jgi:hypothetical protein
VAFLDTGQIGAAPLLENHAEPSFMSGVVASLHNRIGFNSLSVS